MKQLFKVVKCGEMYSVRSEKSEGGTLQKRNIVLRELGGKYAQTYAAEVIGNGASAVFDEGEYVFGVLKFHVYEAPDGRAYQNVTMADFVKLP